MAEEGKLTAGVVGGALLQSMSQFELEAKQMPLTVAGSFQILKNNLLNHNSQNGRSYGRIVITHNANNIGNRYDYEQYECAYEFNLRI